MMTKIVMGDDYVPIVTRETHAHALGRRQIAAWHASAPARRAKARMEALVAQADLIRAQLAREEALGTVTRQDEPPPPPPKNTKFVRRVVMRIASSGEIARVFATAYDAAKEMCVHYSTIYRACKLGYDIKGFTFAREAEE